MIEDTAADDACAAGGNVQSKLEMDAAGSASLAAEGGSSVKNEDLLKDEASVTLEVASNFAEIDSNSFGEASSDVIVIKNDVIVIAGEAKEKTKDQGAGGGLQQGTVNAQTFGASKNPARIDVAGKARDPVVVKQKTKDYNQAWL